jgi:hypothetical protein
MRGSPAQARLAAGAAGFRERGSWGFVDFEEELRIEALHLTRQALGEQLFGALE